MGWLVVQNNVPKKNVLHFVDSNGCIVIDEKAGIYVPDKGDRVEVRIKKSTTGPAAKSFNSFRSSNLIHDYEYMKHQENDKVIEGVVENVYPRYLRVTYADNQSNYLTTTVSLSDMITKRCIVRKVDDIAK